MAVLVFLAGAARAKLVAADLAPARGIGRIARRGARRRGSIAARRTEVHVDRGEFVFAGRGVDVVRLHEGQVLLFGRRLLHDLHAHQLGGDRLAQILAHRFEQVEGFRLVFVQGVALAIAAQPDHIAQMIEHHEMLAPEMVERLQQDRLFDVADDVRAPPRDLRRHVLVGIPLDARNQLLVGDAFFLRPFGDGKIHAEHALDLVLQPRDIPLFGIGVLGNVLPDKCIHHLATHVGDDLRRHLVAHPFDALVEDDLALIVHHVVELEQVLANVVVARLDLLLRVIQRLVDPRMDDRLVLLEAELLQHAVELVRAEDAHQVVFERQEELRAPRIALTAGSSAQLVVDAPRLVPLGAEHEHAAGGERLLLQAGDLLADHVRPRIAHPRLHIGDVGQFLADAHVGVAAELNVGAAAGHVGGDSDRARHARLGDDVGLLLVVARVEDCEHLGLGGAFVAGIERSEGVRIGEVVRLPAALAQHVGELFGLLDRGGADQHRLAALLAVLDQRDDGAVFLRRRAVDLVVLVEADHRQIGRDVENFEIVDVEELVGFRQRRARHARELFVHAEVVLEGDRGERLVFRLDRLAFLRLQRLMQAVGKAPPRHHAPGELVDQHDLVVADDVILVAMEQLVRAQRLIDVMHDRDVLDVVKRFRLELAGGAQRLFHLFHAGFGHGDGALLLVDLEIALVELRDERVDRVVELGTVVERAGNDQRRTRFVDENGVDLVDDRIDVATLDHLFDAVLHIVAQIVEAELVIGPVGDVAGVGLLALLVVEPVHDHAGGQAEKLVDFAHPFGVALGEVVIDGHDVHAAPVQRVEIDRQGRDQRLAFAGPHFRYPALVQHHPTDKLDVEMALPEGALGRLPHGREGGHQQIVERLAFGELLAERLRARPQLLVGKRRDLGLQCIDRGDPRPVGADAPVICRAENLAGDSAEHAGVLS